MAWAKSIEACSDPADYAYVTCAVYSCGYSQPKRQNISAARLKAGTAEIDCSSGVSWWLYMGGYLPECPWFHTAIEKDYLVGKGFKAYKWGSVTPQRNDVLLRSGHTALCIGDGMQAEALRTERYDAGYNGSTPGDQDGGETVVRALGTGGWTWVLRAPAKEADMAFRYQGHVQGVGDQGWRTAGQTAGTTGQAKRLEAVYFDLPKGLMLRVWAHVQGIGDMTWQNITAGMSKVALGTTGCGLRLEALRVEVTQNTAAETKGKTLMCRGHVQDVGWSGWVKAGQTIGTTGQSKRLEAVEFKWQ